MKGYKTPEYHFLHNAGGLKGHEIEKLSDKELLEYFRENNFSEEKKKYCIKPGFVLREIAGEYAIIPVDGESLITNAVMAPNDTAVFLWKAFQKPSTKEDVVRRGMEEYEASEETIRNSINRFVKESLKYKILEEVD